MTKDEMKDEMKDKISMALKDPILQMGFEVICSKLARLEKENTELEEQIAQMKCCENCRYYSRTYGHCYQYDSYQNCKSLSNWRQQNDKKQKTIMNSKGAARAGLCSEERSLISPDYARNFICDFIIGKYQPEISGQSLFDSDYMSDLISCKGA